MDCSPQPSEGLVRLFEDGAVRLQGAIDHGRRRNLARPRWRRNLDRSFQMQDDAVTKTSPESVRGLPDRASIALRAILTAPRPAV